MANDRPINPASGEAQSAPHSRADAQRVARSRAPQGRPPQGRGPQDKTFIERQLRQKKRARVWRGSAIVLLLLIVGGIAYGTLTQHGRDTVSTFKSAGNMALTAKTNPNLIFDNARSDHVNILLIGRDVNYKMTKVYDPKTKQMRPFHAYDEEASARSDTMIVVTLDKRHNTIRMVSFPRDAMVRLAPNKEGVRRAKLNAAHAYGGPELLMQTLHDELGLTIHHYAVIRFEGFKKLIDQVGGIEVDVLGALHRDGSRGRLKYDDNWGNLHIDLEPGKQWLDGQSAHNYVRFRMDTEGDPGRIRRQQGVMRSLAKRIMQQPFYKIPGLVQEVQRQFKTDLQEDEIASAAAFAQGIGDASKIQPITLFGTYGHRGAFILNEDKNKQLLSFIFGSTFRPDRFLQRSPTTELHDVGGEDTPNPATHALLREAGLIKGEPPLHAEARDESSSSSPRRSELELETLPRSGDTRSYDLPVITADRETSRRERESERETVIPDLSLEAPSSPRRILRERANRSERESERETKRREKARREESAPRRETVEPETSRETPARREGIAPENQPARRDLDVESPAPAAEDVAPASE